jgi:hypothetical protein
MRRRESPYSQIETIRRSRGELVVLVLGTVAMGILLNLLASGLHDALRPSGEAPGQQWLVLTVEGLITLALIVSMVLFYGRMESQRALVEVWLPYHWPESGHPKVAQRRSYQITVHARRAFARRYSKSSPQTQAFATGWREAIAQGIPFPQFIAPVNAQLIQHLLLCVLHRYGEDSLSPDAAYGWWAVNLPAEQLTMNDLPEPVRDNPFLRADQKPEEWRLWWPRDVRLELHSDGNSPFPTWRFVHGCYGYLEVKARPQLVVAGRESQPVRVFLQRLKLSKRSQLYVVGTRLEAVARFQWAFLPGSEPFHDWATGLLSYLEEALDWLYFLATRPDRLITDLDWKMGWVPKGTSVWEKLEEIEGRLEDLEMESVLGDSKLGDS